MNLNICPVCGQKLDFRPWNEDSASDEICPGCGIQFGLNDARKEIREKIYLFWREEWLKSGRRAFHGNDWKEVSKRVGKLATMGKTMG